MSWRCLPALQYNGIIRLVVLREPKNQDICEVKQQCLFYDPLTQDNPQSSLRKVSCRNQYGKKKPKVILQYEKIKNYFGST